MLGKQVELVLAVVLAEVLLPSCQGGSPGDAEEALLVIHGCVIHYLKTRRLNMDEHLSVSLVHTPGATLLCPPSQGLRVCRLQVRVPAGALVTLGQGGSTLQLVPWSLRPQHCAGCWTEGLGSLLVLTTGCPQFLATWASPWGSSQHGSPQSEQAKAG